MQRINLQQDITHNPDSSKKSKQQENTVYLSKDDKIYIYGPFKNQLKRSRHFSMYQKYIFLLHKM